MAHAIATIDALCAGSALELDTLQHMEEGSAVLFKGLIVEAQKRKAALEELKLTSNPHVSKGATSKGISAHVALSVALGEIRAQIDACKKSIGDSYERYEKAYDDAHAQYKRETQLVSLIKGFRKEAIDLYCASRDIISQAESSEVLEIKHYKHLTTAGLVEQAEKLCSQCDQVFADQGKAEEVMNNDVDQAWKLHSAEKSALETQIAGLYKAEQALLVAMST